MHILGKILTWTVFVGAIAGTVLMSRHLQIKNSYTKKLGTLKTQNIKDAEEIKGKEAELHGLNLDFERVMHEQLAYWDKRPGTPDPASGSINLSVGTQQGVGVVVTTTLPAGKVKRRTTLFLFSRPNGNAPQTKFIGEFVVKGEPGPQNSTVEPTWTLRSADIPDDRVDTWPDRLKPNESNTYRIRTAIPTRYSTAFRALYLDLEKVDRNIVSAKAEQVRAQSFLKSSEAEVIKYRVKIAGNDGTGGMLGEISQAEENRDTILADVDRLRRGLKTELDTRQNLVDRNRNLVKKLAQPVSSSGRKP